jgi:signal transduction histidine kinase
MNATGIPVRKPPGVDPHEATPRAEQSDLANSDLLARISHEMRTPLSAILGYAQLMNSGTPSLTISQQRSIDRILQAGWYLEKLIAMTRDLALIESGTLSLSLEPVPIAAVLRDCQAMIEPQARVRGVHVTFPVFESPLSVSADRFRLQDALGNLLAAAIENSDVNGAVVVNCETRGPEWIRTEIHYGGTGSSAERLTAHLPPCDGPKGRATAVDGGELGLLLAQRLVELMGGAIAGEGIDGARKAFFVDLKRGVAAMAAGRATTQSVVGAAQVPHVRQPQSPAHSRDDHAQQG